MEVSPTSYFAPHQTQRNDVGKGMLAMKLSSHVKNALITNIVYLNKKRKFQDEQLGLPLPKHKCFERMLSSECDSPLNQGPENEGFQTSMIYEDTERGTSDDGSGLKSAKDSNSFVTDSDSATSVYGEAKSKLDFAKTCTYDQPSTSSGNWGVSSFQNTANSLDSRIVTNMGTGKEELTYMVVGQHPHHQNDKLQEYHHLEEHLLEFEDLINYSCSDYGNDSIEQCKDEDLGDIPNSGLNPNTYALSSGRWSVNRDAVAQPGTKKPTIDQEFEQYFSSLMLH